MYLNVARPADHQKRMIEGPTPKQAKQMAATAQLWRASNIFELNCDAMDLEADLIRYGFDPQTGRRKPKGR